MLCLVGFAGAMGSGKTVRAQALAANLRKLDVLSYVESFADPVKHLASILAGEHDRIATRPDKGSFTRYGITYGALCQHIGQSLRSSISDDVWINQAEDMLRINYAPMIDSDTEKLVIIFDDLRYLNEAEWIMSQGGFVVRLDHKVFVRNDGRDAKHQSETEWSRIHTDYAISNWQQDAKHLMDDPTMLDVRDEILTKLHTRKDSEDEY